MAEYIEREAFLADKKWLYCTDCDKRKGKKRGKMVTLYEIGEAPCKSCGIHDMLEEVEDYPAADVQPVRHGRWIKTIGENGVTSACRCNLCGFEDNRYSLFNYCPNCGARLDFEEDNG